MSTPVNPSQKRISTRVLLIDNYSSFTYNLWQLLANICEEPPIVLSNDAPLCAVADRQYDCIVLSPGPGTPTHKQDFGICLDMLQQTDKPLLGICLGHQGLGMHWGAKVVAAPNIVHGRPSDILCEKDPLFCGLPRQFSAIRYHSLLLQEPLPAALKCIARTESDGLVMAVAHREYPHWGVQFHPESFATEYGITLLQNFCALSQSSQPQPIKPAAHVRAPVPQKSQWRTLSHTIQAPNLSSQQIHTALYASSSSSFWLDGATGEGVSWLGDVQGQYGYSIRYQQSEHTLYFAGAKQGSVQCDSIFDYLKRALAGIDIAHNSELEGFVGGFIGYLGYELKAEVGARSRHQSSQPDAFWIWPERWIGVDHATGDVHLMACIPSGADTTETQSWFDATETVLRSVLTVPMPSTFWSAPTDSVPPTVNSAIVEENIRMCHEALIAGESYELCLCTQLSSDINIDPNAVYQTLRERNPAPYAAFLQCEEFSILSASPERFMKISANGTVACKPIKGTARRDGDSATDQQLALELLNSEKERAENLMIVDLVRNDLGKTCEIGSVTVQSFASLESYATVHQLVSTITGQLRTDKTPIDCVKGAFPGGSMTGAPKLRSMNILDELETSARGVYSGSIGYLSCNGSVDLSIVIRTIVADRSGVSIGVGGAITSLSDTEEEIAEFTLKAHSQLEVLFSS